MVEGGDKKFDGSDDDENAMDEVFEVLELFKRKPEEG